MGWSKNRIADHLLGALPGLVCLRGGGIATFSVLYGWRNPLPLVAVIQPFFSICIFISELSINAEMAVIWLFFQI